MHTFKSTNKSTRSSFAGVRVYDANQVRVVEYPLDQRNPLGYLKAHNGKHRKSFIDMCSAAGVTQIEIDGLFGAQK